MRKKHPQIHRDAKKTQFPQRNQFLSPIVGFTRQSQSSRQLTFCYVSGNACLPRVIRVGFAAIKRRMECQSHAARKGRTWNAIKKSFPIGTGWDVLILGYGSKAPVFCHALAVSGKGPHRYGCVLSMNYLQTSHAHDEQIFYF